MSELLVDFITSLDGYGAAEGWRNNKRLPNVRVSLHKHVNILRLIDMKWKGKLP